MSIDRYISKIENSELLTEQQVKNLTQSLIGLLLLTPNVIEVSGQQYIIGDIHGQFYDLVGLLNKTIPKIGQKNYIFLGDYVDRGYNSLETICYLFAYKCKYPSKIILLRGNHETSSLTKIYGFYDEVNQKYGNLKVWKMITEAFQYLPLAAVIQNEVLCIHGGLSPKIGQIDQISWIDRIVQIPEVGAMCDLLWSDPEVGIPGWIISNRGAGYFFNHQITKQFLYLNNLKMVARAHQLVQEGYIYNFGDQSLVTIWSAPNYCYRCGNQAAVLKIDQKLQKQYIKFQASPLTNKNKIHYDNILPYFL